MTNTSLLPSTTLEKDTHKACDSVNVRPQSKMENNIALGGTVILNTTNPRMTHNRYHLHLAAHSGMDFSIKKNLSLLHFTICPFDVSNFRPPIQTNLHFPQRVLT